MRAVLQTLLVASSMGTLGGADDNPGHSQIEPNPREVVAAFLDVVAIGDTDGAAQSFTTGDPKVVRSTKMIRQTVPNAKVPIATVHANESRAFVVTKLMNGKLVRGNPGVFTIALGKAPHIGWRIHTIKYQTEDSAHASLEHFRTDCPTARPIPPTTFE
jgi:hypothetical protein